MSHRESVEHELKVAPSHFHEIRALRKRQEFRSTADRDFQVGDILVLQEFVPEPRVASFDPSVQIVSTGFTGQEERRIITHILDKAGFEPVPEGWAILSLDEVPYGDNVEPLGTTGHLDPRRVYRNALDSDQLARLAAVTIVGWLSDPRQLLYASSEPSAESVLLLERAKKEILDRVELDEEVDTSE